MGCYDEQRRGMATKASQTPIRSHEAKSPLIVTCDRCGGLTSEALASYGIDYIFLASPGSQIMDYWNVPLTRVPQWVAIFVVVFLTACAGGHDSGDNGANTNTRPPPFVPSANMLGSWSGTWSGSLGAGSLSFFFDQAAINSGEPSLVQLTGTGDINGSACFSDLSRSLVAYESGSHLSLSFQKQNSPGSVGLKGDLLEPTILGGTLTMFGTCVGSTGSWSASVSSLSTNFDTLLAFHAIPGKWSGTLSDSVAGTEASMSIDIQQVEVPHFSVPDAVFIHGLLTISGTTCWKPILTSIPGGNGRILKNELELSAGAVYDPNSTAPSSYGNMDLTAQVTDDSISGSFVIQGGPGGVCTGHTGTWSLTKE